MSEKITKWTANFVEYKHGVRGELEDIRVTENEIDVKLKKGKKKYICIDSLEALNVSNLEEEIIATLNKKENVEWLYNNWSKLEKTNTSYFFVNPQKESYWAVNPRNHSKVTGKKDLKKGLLSLFESCPEVK